MVRARGDSTHRDAENQRGVSEVTRTDEQPQQDTELLECAAVAALLGLTARGVRWLAETGRIPYYRTASGRRYYLRADVERIAAERAAGRA